MLHGSKVILGKPLLSPILESQTKEQPKPMPSWELAKIGFAIGQGNAAGGAFTAGWIFGADNLPYFRPVAAAVVVSLGLVTAACSVRSGGLNNPAVKYLSDAGKVLAAFMPLLIIGAFSPWKTEISYQQENWAPVNLSFIAFIMGLALLGISKKWGGPDNKLDRILVEPLADWGGRATGWAFTLGLGWDVAGLMGFNNFGPIGMLIWSLLVGSKMLATYLETRTEPLAAKTALYLNNMTSLFSENWPLPAALLMGEVMDYQDPSNSANYIIPAATMTALAFGLRSLCKDNTTQPKERSPESFELPLNGSYYLDTEVIQGMA